MTRGGRKAGRASLALAGVLATAPAAAQTTPPATPPQLPSQSDISRARVGLPPPDAPQVDLTIQTPERAAVPRSVDTLDFNLSHISVEGATVFSAAQVNAIFAPLIGRTVQLEAIRERAQQLEDLYRAHGYFLTRVFVPPQRIEGGSLTIRVIEGYIDRIDVEGLDASTRREVAAALDSLRGRRPIDLASVERRLLILNDMPGIVATSVLRQGTALGASDLFVTLKAPAGVVQASVSNTNSRLLGPWVYALNANLPRPFGAPGALALGVAASGPGLGATQSGSWRYSAGLGASGIVGSVGQIVARAHPVGSLTPLDVRNDLLSTSIRLRYPLVRTRGQSLFVEGGVSINQSSTDILDEQAVDDHDTVADIALTYQQAGWFGGTTTVAVDLFHGLAVWSEDRDAPRPSVAGFDPSFTRLTYSIQRLQALPRRFSLLAAVQGQYTGDKLLTGELVAFGGPAIGRAYDPSIITGDRGIGGVAELRYDLPVGKPWLSTVQFYGFADAAQATTLASAYAPAVTARVSSLGGGIRLGQRYLSADLQLAKQLRVYTGADARHDPRVLLTVTATY